MNKDEITKRVDDLCSRFIYHFTGILDDAGNDACSVFGSAFQSMIELISQYLVDGRMDHESKCGYLFAAGIIDELGVMIGEEAERRKDTIIDDVEEFRADTFHYYNEDEFEIQAARKGEE